MSPPIADVRDWLRRLTEAHAKDKARLEHLSNECAEASADAARQTAGIREVALFRAANAKAVMGGYALPLIQRNEQLLAALTAVLDLHTSDGADTPFCYECGHTYPCLTVRTVVAAAGDQP